MRTGNTSILFTTAPQHLAQTLGYEGLSEQLLWHQHHEAFSNPLLKEIIHRFSKNPAYMADILCFIFCYISMRNNVCIVFLYAYKKSVIISYLWNL